MSSNSCQRYPCPTASRHAVVTRSGPVTAPSNSRCAAPASCQPGIRPADAIKPWQHRPRSSRNRDFAAKAGRRGTPRSMVRDVLARADRRVPVWFRQRAGSPGSRCSAARAPSPRSRRTGRRRVCGTASSAIGPVDQLQFKQLPPQVPVRNEAGQLVSHAGGRPQPAQPSTLRLRPLSGSRPNRCGASITLRHRRIVRVTYY